MKKSQKLWTLILSIGLTCISLNTLANTDKWYRVEVLVIEAKDKSALAEEWPLNPGKPSLANAVDLNQDTTSDFSLLNDNQLTLGRAKKRLQQNYRLIMHKGWRQTLSDKDNAPKVHLMGGQNYSGSSATDSQHFEVDGVLKLSSGRYLNVDADLLFHKPMKIVSSANVELGVPNNMQGTARFVEVSSKSWQEDSAARLQTFRLKESSRLKVDELHYIDHPLYGIIIVVSPEKATS